MRSSFFKKYGLDGWLRGRETIIGRGSGKFHVHDHAVMLFREPIPLIKYGDHAGEAQNAVNQELSDAWRKATGGDSFIVKIKAFDGNYHELIKYITKSTADMTDAQLAEFVTWQKNQPFLFRGGSLRNNPELKAAIKASEDLSKEEDLQKVECPTCGCTETVTVVSNWSYETSTYHFFKVLPSPESLHHFPRGP